MGLAQAGRHAGLWPVASEQTGTLLITLVVAVKSRQRLRIPLRAAGLPLLAGGTGVCAPRGPAARALQPRPARRPRPGRPGHHRHRPQLIMPARTGQAPAVSSLKWL